MELNKYFDSKRLQVIIFNKVMTKYFNYLIQALQVYSLNLNF